MIQTAAGYACRGTDEQDLGAQRQAVAALGRRGDGPGGPTLTSQHPHLTKVKAAHEQITPQPAKLLSIGRPCACPVPPRHQAK